MARVLVVDDEEDVRSFLCEALRRAGHETVAADDGRAALDRLSRERFDALLTDLSMPGIDGMELVRRVRVTHPALPVVILTAYGSVPIAVEAMKLGVVDFLEKPVESPAALRRVVAMALGRAAQESATDEAPRLGHGSPAMAAVEDALRRVAATEATVLLLGESGVGKEVAARALHRWSRRAAGPFAAINCAALSDTLLESELFGHERGAFTGAVAPRAGRIEEARGGTFFLDEIGELKPDLQARILRVLQEREFTRVGGSRTLQADVRWVAATNRDLRREVAAGRFREDLFHRVSVFPVEIPPLRARREDIPALADALLARIRRTLGRPELALDDAGRAALAAMPWPGNVRELANALERAAILSDGPTLRVAAPAPSAQPPAEPRDSVVTMEEAEHRAIERALQRYEGNRRLAADHLGIGLRTLYEKLKKYGIR